MSVIPETTFDIDDLLQRASKITGIKPVRSTPLSRDEDLAVRTIIGEAKGEGEKGWEGVADVIRNRSKQSGKSFGDVVLAPGQFEPWSSRKKELDSYDPNSPIFQQVSKTVLPVLRGERMGPAKDATHFYGPKSQAALGRPAPSWDNGKGIDIGNHRFFNLGYSGNGQHGIGTPEAAPLDYTDLLKRADAITGLSKQAAPDYTDLLAQTSAITGVPDAPSTGALPQGFQDTPDPEYVKSLESPVVNSQYEVAPQSNLTELFPGSGREQVRRVMSTTSLPVKTPVKPSNGKGNGVSTTTSVKEKAPTSSYKGGTVTANVEIGAPVLEDNRVFEQPRNWKAGDKDMTDDDILKGEDRYGVNLKDVPDKDRSRVALTQVFSRLQKQYGLSSDQLEGFVQRGLNDNDLLADDTIIHVSRQAVADMGGNPVEKVRAEQKENYQPVAQKAFDNQLKSDRDKIPAYENSIEGQPGDDPLFTQARANVQGSALGIQGGDYNADVQKEYERLKKWTLTEDEKAEAQGVGGNLAQQTGGAAKSGIVGAGGRTLQSLAGALGYVAVPGMIPEEWQIALSKHGQKMSLAEETEAEKNPGLLNKGIRLVSGLAGDTPRFLLLSKLPGGMTSMFAVDAGLQSAGRGDRPQTVAGNVAKGAVTGKIFGSASKWARAAEAGVLTKLLSGVTPDAKSLLAKFAGTGTRLATRDSQRLAAKILGIGTKIGSVAGGTATQTKLEGGTTEQSLESGLTNALLVLALEHNGNAVDGAKKLAGKIFRGKLGDKTKTVTIDENGDIHKLTKDVPDKLVDVNIALTPKEVDTKISKVMENYDAEGKRIEKKSPPVKETVKLDTLNKIPVVKKAPESAPKVEKASTPVATLGKPSAPVVGEAKETSIIYQDTDLHGKAKEPWMLTKHEYEEAIGEGDIPDYRLYAEQPSAWRDGARIPDHDFGKVDLQDSGKRVTEDTIRKDYNVHKHDNKDADIYEGYIPIEDVPRPKLVEREDPEEGVDYDWSEMSRKGEYPPAKIRIKPDGELEILDGNHRIEYWEDADYTHIPAWIIDERKIEHPYQEAQKSGQFDKAIKEGRMSKGDVQEIIQSFEGGKPKTSPSVAEKPVEVAKEYGSTNKLVTIDRAKEIREALSKKLKASSNTASAGLPVDAETVRLVGELGLFHLEAGARKFADFAAKMKVDGIDFTEKKLHEIYDTLREKHNFPDMDAKESSSTESAIDNVGTSKVGRTLEQKTIEKGLTNAFSELAEYDKITIKGQAEKMATLLEEPDRITKIISGEEPLPSDIRSGSFIQAVEAKALADGDVQTLQNLAKSKITSDTSVAAQELRTLVGRNPDSPLAKMKEVEKAREDAAQKRLPKNTTVKDAVKKEVAKIKDVVKKSAPNRQDFQDFLRQISCNY